MRPKIVLYYNDLEFTPSESFLYKDFGQVPHVLATMYDTDLEYWISASRINPEFRMFRGKVVRQFGKRLGLLPKRLDALKNQALYRAITRARAVTHFMIFPFTPMTDLRVARRARRRGAKIIVKLDTNREYLETLATDWRKVRHSPGRFLRQCHCYRELLRIADLIMCETTECEQVLKVDFLDLDIGHKLVKTFSGLSEAWLAEIGVQDVADVARERSIIVSGRISSHQKHSALIFEAGPPPPGWRIEFIGEVDAGLAKTIAAHRAADPDFDDHYRFHGAITDKRTYFGHLMRSRALLMNSRGGEGFPNVFAEAHYCRLLIASSDVSGADDATGEGRWGMIYSSEDVGALRSVLQALPSRVAAASGAPAPEEHRRRFIWERSLDQPAIRRLFDSDTVQAPLH